MEIPQMMEMLLRTVLAALCGSAVGIERSRRFKDAGIKTYCMVACAAAVFIIISKYGFADLSGASIGTGSADPSRIAAQIVTGVSFLGAGIIYRDKQHSLKGLTTAAGIWFVAGIGMAMGAGLYFLAVFATLFVLLIQYITHRCRTGSRKNREARLEVFITDDPDAAGRFDAFLRDQGVIPSGYEISRKDGQLMFLMDIKLPEGIRIEDIRSGVAAIPYINSMRINEVPSK